MQSGLRGLRLPLFLIFLLTLCAPVLAQNAGTTPRIFGEVDDLVRVPLKGNVHPLAQARYDHGAVGDSFPVERMLLLLKRSDGQEAALSQFLSDAHTPGSSRYHHWLTPSSFAAQ
jgi:hypothetical protein